MLRCPRAISIPSSSQMRRDDASAVVVACCPALLWLSWCCCKLPFSIHLVAGPGLQELDGCCTPLAVLRHYSCKGSPLILTTLLFCRSDVRKQHSDTDGIKGFRRTCLPVLLVIGQYPPVLWAVLWEHPQKAFFCVIFIG